MPTTSSDGQLVVQLQSGDLDALGILYERHKTCVYRTALAITRDPTVAEDILQDCFLRLQRYSHSIDCSLPLKPWLYRVTVNLVYSMARRKKYWVSSIEAIIDWLAGPIQESPEWQAEMSDMRSDVMKAISSLSINQRVVIILYYLNSLSLNEIALILGCPIGTVKSRLYYGRENLRRKLSGKYAMTTERVCETV